MSGCSRLFRLFVYDLKFCIIEHDLFFSCFCEGDRGDAVVGVPFQPEDLSEAEFLVLHLHARFKVRGVVRREILAGPVIHDRFDRRLPAWTDP